jgi:AmmeMemoRadiSam system protein A
MGVIAETQLRLPPALQVHLLRAARCAMAAAVRKDAPPGRSIPDDLLLTHSGAFVTLTIAGELRGCMGYFEPLHPLIDTVTEAAVKAALDDHRFPPVRVDELPRIRLQISVVSCKAPVSVLDEIVVGRDGLYIESESARGLLLPQVAAEHGWDAGRFLEQTFRKCGLSPAPVGARGIGVYRFTAEIFSEDALSEPEGDR